MNKKLNVFLYKESNNLDEVSILGINENSYIEYENIQDFYNWVLTLKPKDVKNYGISERGLRNVKSKIRKGIGLKNKSKILKILISLYKIKNNDYKN